MSSASSSALLAYLQSNSQLVDLLKDPSVKACIISLLEEETAYQNRQRAYEARQQSRNHGAGFPNPNNAPLSPLEKVLIEGNSSPVQQALRLLLKQILQEV